MKKQFCIYLLLEDSDGDLIKYNVKFEKINCHAFPGWIHEFLIITNTINIPRNICKKLNKYKEIFYSYDSWANGS